MNYDLLWSLDEYNSILKYKWNTFKRINLFLSEELTNREKNYKGQGKSIPRNEEEFVETIENIITLYKTIKKNYILNGSQQIEHKLYRGTRNNSNHLTFASTTADLSIALSFLNGIDNGKTETDLLLEIQPSNVPYLEIEKYVSASSGGDLNESEILFAPCYQKLEEEISFDDFKQTLNDTTSLPLIMKTKLKRLNNLECKRVQLVSYSNNNIESNISLSELSEKYNHYFEALSKLSSLPKESLEFQHIYQEIKAFKKECFSYLNTQFQQIDKEIEQLVSQKTDEKIDLNGKCSITPVKIGNTGEMYLVVDSENKEYYFKPSVNKKGEIKNYRACIQASAYDIQRIINPSRAVKCNMAMIDGKFGAIQEKINVDITVTQNFKNYFNKNIGQLDPKTISQIMDEYLVDYCLCNYDSNANNFVIDEDGNLRGIDKEQSFRYLGQDVHNDMFFSQNFNEQYGENKTIYAIIFEKMQSGEISSNYLNGLIYRSARIAQIPDDKYRNIFKNYAYDKMPTQQEAELLLDRIVERKQSIVAKVDLFVEQIKNASYQKGNKSTQDYVFTDDLKNKTHEEAEIFMEEEFGKEMVNTQQTAYNKPHIRTEVKRKVEKRDLRLQTQNKTEKEKLEEERRELRSVQFNEKSKSTIVNTQKVPTLTDVLRQQQLLQQQMIQQQQQIEMEDELEQHHGMSM